MTNQEILRSLPQAQNIQGQYAVLARLDGKRGWRFLMQPTEISSDRSSNYSQTNTIGSLPNLQFVTLEGWQVTINNLPLSGWQQKRKLDDYVAAIASLQNADATKGSPPVLALIWGQRQVLSPCVMTKFSKSEKMWYPSGELAECAIGFTLVEVPSDQIIN